MKTNINQAWNVDQMSQTCMKQAEDMMSGCREASDALMKSSTIWAKGLEEMMKACVSQAQSTSEKNANLWQSLMGCKTVNEWAEAQNKLAQESFEDVLNVTAQVSEMSVKCIMDAAEPINKQWSTAMKKANEQMAA